MNIVQFIACITGSDSPGIFRTSTACTRGEWRSFGVPSSADNSGSFASRSRSRFPDCVIGLIDKRRRLSALTDFPRTTFLRFCNADWLLFDINTVPPASHSYASSPRTTPSSRVYSRSQNDRRMTVTNRMGYGPCLYLTCPTCLGIGPFRPFATALTAPQIVSFDVSK